MKIIVTGSLGHISKPLTGMLVQGGHTVTVISSSAEKQAPIEALGATAAIGSLEDADFITRTFTGADLVYCMVPPNHHIDTSIDPAVYYTGIGRNYAQAIRASGVKRVIHLSSVGAHMEKDSGLILAHRAIELLLREIPGISLTHMRPTAFYYNLLAFIPVIKAAGMMASNYGGDDCVPWVAPADIAAAIADEIAQPATEHKIRYVASEEPTCSEIARTLGEAIGMPDLKWIVIPDEQMRSRLESAGVSKTLAAALVEMNAAMHKGLLQEDYFRHRPELGSTKLRDFAQDFAKAFKA